MNKYYLRINGRGNAWPVSLGQEHPFIQLRSGLEDEKYYERKILNSTELQDCLNKSADKLGLSTTFMVAVNGDYFRL